jgi:hypothetical protein
MLKVMQTHVETRARPWNTLDQVFSADLVFAFVRAIADVAGVCNQKRIVQVMLGFGNTEYYVVREKSSNNYEGYDEFRHLSDAEEPKLTRLLEFLGCATKHHKAVKEDFQWFQWFRPTYCLAYTFGSWRRKYYIKS